MVFHVLYFISLYFICHIELINSIQKIFCAYCVTHFVIQYIKQGFINIIV